MDYVAREQYSLPDAEKDRIEMILTKALKKEKGEPIDEDMFKNDLKDEDDEEEEAIEEDDDDEGMSEIMDYRFNSLMIVLCLGAITEPEPNIQV